MFPEIQFDGECFMKNLVALIFIFSFLLLISCENENNLTIENDNETGDETGETADENLDETTDEVIDDDVEYKCLQHCWMSPYKNPLSIYDRYQEKGSGVEIVVVDTLTGLEWASFGNPSNFNDDCSNLVFDKKSDWRDADQYDLESIKLYHNESFIVCNLDNSDLNPFKISSNVGKCVRGEKENAVEEPNRFFEKTVTGDKVVTDQKTGLIWTGKTLEASNNVCEDLVYGGRDDWELPDLFQLRTLISWEKKSPVTYFPHVEEGVYKSSFWIPNSDMRFYYSVDFMTGSISAADFYNQHVLCVIQESSVEENRSPESPFLEKISTNNSAAGTCVDKECGWNPGFCGECDYEKGFFCNNFKCEQVEQHPYQDRNSIVERFVENTDDGYVYDKYSGLEWEIINYGYRNILSSKDVTWREPDISELETLFNYWKTEPPYTDLPGFQSGLYASSSPANPDYHTEYYEYYKNDIFAADFEKLEIIWYENINSFKHISVRGEKKESNPYRYQQKIFNDQVIIFDIETNLQWTKKGVEGLELEESVQYCENLEYGGKTDWHLPDVYELVTMLDRSRANPASSSTYISPRDYWAYNKKADKGFKFDFQFGWIGKKQSSYTEEIYTICVRN